MNKKEKNKKKLFSKKLIFALAVFIVAAFICKAGFAPAYALAAEKVDSSFSVGGVVGSVVGTVVLAPINAVLYVVFVFMGLLMVIAGIIFDWAINPNNFKAVMQLQAIRDGWTMVRDFFNVGFILILLFSAFCTVFQVEKYHMKKIIIMLVIMALLINFSFPIARFIIDIGNVTMYYLLNIKFGDMGNNTGLVTSLLQGAGFMKMFAPSGWTVIGGITGTIKILASIVFTFLFAATMLTLGILLIIRILVLAIVIIFSPIGFFGQAFPGTNKFSGMWWDALFKQSFFGVVMAFMLVISMNIMEGMTQGNVIKDTDIGAMLGGDGQEFSTIIVAGVSMAIPIVLLWIGMIAAQKIGAVGAAQAQKIGMGAMKKFGGVNAVQRGWKAYQSRRQEAQKGGLATKWGAKLASQQDRLRSVVKLPGMQKGARDAGNRYEADRLKEVDEAYKSHNMADMDAQELNAIKKDGNADEKAAAIKALAEKGQATQGDLDNVRKAFGETSQVFKQLSNKVKAYDPVAAFAYLEEPKRQARMVDHLNSNQFDSKKVNTHSLGNAEFMELAMSNGSLSIKDIAELRKDASKNAAMKSSIGAIVSEGHRNSPKSDADKNIHMANFALTGKIHDTGFSEHIAENLDKDNAANMTLTALSQIGAHKNKIKQGRIKDIVENIKDNNAARELVRDLADANTSSHANYVNNNANLKNYI